MAPKKREPNTANVSSKARKVSNGLGEVVKSKDRIAFKEGVKQVAAQIADNPQALKKVQALMEAEMIEQDLDADLYFTKEQAAGGIEKLKQKYAAEEVLPVLCDALSTRLVKALAKVDTKVHTKLQMRLCYVSEKHPFGPREKVAWLGLWGGRAKKFSGFFQLTYDPITFKIDWGISGHYALMPAMAAGDDPLKHRYLQVSFLRRVFDLPSDMVFNGEWVLEMNWDYATAYLAVATKPWRREPIFPIIGEQAMQELVPKMSMIASRADVLAIENGPKLAAVKDGNVTETPQKLPAITDVDTAVEAEKKEKQPATIAVEAAQEKPPATDVTTAVEAEQKEKKEPPATDVANAATIAEEAEQKEEKKGDTTATKVEKVEEKKEHTEDQPNDNTPRKTFPKAPTLKTPKRAGPRRGTSSSKLEPDEVE